MHKYIDTYDIYTYVTDFLNEDGGHHHEHTHDKAVTSVGIMREGVLDLDKVHTATHCNTLQHTATHTATHCNLVQHY